MSHIEQIEDQIEALREAIERSRRLMLIGRGCAISGVALLAWWLVRSGLPGFVWFVSGVALSLGGLVLMGSSKSSTDELESSLRKALRTRDAAIDELRMRDVGPGDAEPPA